MQTLLTGSDEPGLGFKTLNLGLLGLWIHDFDPATHDEGIIVYHCILSYFGVIKQFPAKT